jgi:FMN phosphatase YigB (HAD superfamily)
MSLKSIGLLLDFDGVLLNNEKINEKIEHRAAKFVGKKMHISESSARTLNRKHYKKYGHSVYMLNHFFKKRGANAMVTLEEFNTYLYQRDFAQECCTLINHKDKRLFSHWMYAIETLRKKNLVDEVCIFSNSPRIWMTDSLQYMDEAYSDQIEAIISVPEKYDDLLKPNKSVYTAFENDKAHIDKIVFVDDNITNLQHDPWINILYTPHTQQISKEKTCDDETTITISHPHDVVYNIIYHCLK